MTPLADHRPGRGDHPRPVRARMANRRDGGLAGVLIIALRGNQVAPLLLAIRNRASDRRPWTSSTPRRPTSTPAPSPPTSWCCTTPACRPARRRWPAARPRGQGLVALPGRGGRPDLPPGARGAPGLARRRLVLEGRAQPQLGLDRRRDRQSRPRVRLPRLPGRPGRRGDRLVGDIRTRWRSTTTASSATPTWPPAARRPGRAVPLEAAGRGRPRPLGRAAGGARRAAQRGRGGHGGVRPAGRPHPAGLQLPAVGQVRRPHHHRGRAFQRHWLQSRSTASPTARPARGWSRCCGRPADAPGRGHLPVTDRATLLASWPSSRS
jgi:hypothetical protein